jgi:hypothetical protein
MTTPSPAQQEVTQLLGDWSGGDASVRKSRSDVYRIFSKKKTTPSTRISDIVLFVGILRAQEGIRVTRAAKVPAGLILGQAERLDRWLVDRAGDFQTVVSLVRAQRLT